MLKEKFIVTSNDIDKNLEIKISSLMRYMQQVATDHADKLKIGHKDLLKDRNIWVVIRMQLNIVRLPKLDEEFIVTTHPGENKMFIYPRYFQVYDKHGKLLVTVSSTWVVINYDTRRVVLKPFGDRKLPVESDKDDIELPEKITCNSLEFIEKRKARYSEVDMNGHINNTRYVDYIMDLHDSDYYVKNRISSICINFDKEIIEGDEISLYSNKLSPEIVHGKINDVDSFSARIEYKK